MTTVEDIERIALLHTLLAIREHGERLTAQAGPATAGTGSSAGQSVRNPPQPAWRGRPRENSAGADSGSARWRLRRR